MGDEEAIILSLFTKQKQTRQQQRRAAAAGGYSHALLIPPGRRRRLRQMPKEGVAVVIAAAVAAAATITTVTTAIAATANPIAAVAPTSALVRSYFQGESLLDLLHELLLGGLVEVRWVQQRGLFLFARKVPAREATAQQEQDHLPNVRRRSGHELLGRGGDVPLVQGLQVGHGCPAVEHEHALVGWHRCPTT